LPTKSSRLSCRVPREVGRLAAQAEVILLLGLCGKVRQEKDNQTENYQGNLPFVRLKHRNFIAR
jgi:hypothetical protein